VSRFRLVLLFGLMLVALAGCGGGGGDGQQGGPAGAKAQAAPELRVLRPDARSTTRESRVTVEGTVTAGASVEVDGRRAEIEGPANDVGSDRWSAEVPVDRGRNVIEVTAKSEGGSAREEIIVVRRAPAKSDGSDDNGGTDGPETADADPGSGDQGGTAGDQGGAAGETGGNQGGSGGSGGNQGGSGGSGGGNQGGSGGATDGNQGGGVGGPPPEGDQGGPPGIDGGQGGPPAAPPPGSP
jgi:hypothetical protein